jgi:hypothetical protein
MLVLQYKYATKYNTSSGRDRRGLVITLYKVQCGTAVFYGSETLRWSKRPSVYMSYLLIYWGNHRTWMVTGLTSRGRIIGDRNI